MRKRRTSTVGLTRNDLRTLEFRLNKRISDLESRFDNRFTDLESRFDKRISDLESRFHRRLLALESRFSQQFLVLEARVGKRFVDLERRLNEKIGQLITAVDRLLVLAEKRDQEYEALRFRVSRHEEWINRIAQKVGVNLEES